MLGKFTFKSQKSETEFDIKAKPRIYFTRSINNESADLTSYLASPKHPKMIFLLNPSYKFDIFKLIERQFTITTNKGSYLFNIDFLKDASSTIREFIKKNPQKLQYHLNTEDEENIMQTIEKLYFGEKVKFSDDQIDLLTPIAKELNLDLDFLKFKNIFSNISSTYDLQIKLSSLYSFLREKLPRTFSIITQNKEYQCNIIGIHSSKIIDELLSKDPTFKQYKYDFADEFGEFQQICDLFNFNFVKINIDNMNTIKTIAEDLQIDCVLNDIEDFIEGYEKRVQTIDEQQSIIDSIDELFEILYNIKQITVESVKQKIIESDWIKTEENIQELVAFILQAIQTDFILHPYLADLIELLDKESNEFEQLKIIVPFTVKKLMYLLGQNKLICSFIFLLQQRGMIEKDEIMDIFEKLAPNKQEQNMFNSNFSRLQYDLKNKCESYLIFLPELFEIFDSNLDKLLGSFDGQFHNFINLYFPDKIEDFKKMRESGEPDDQITKALRNDDVDTLQSIVSKNHIDIIDTLVPFNIFEEFVPNGKTNYIDYSAAYGSVKCFKYLLLNHATVTQNSFDLAVFGRNIEIVKIIDQKLAEPKEKEEKKKTFSLKSVINSSRNERRPMDTIISTVKKHQNDLFDWIFEQKFKDAIQNNNLIRLIILNASQNGDSHSIASIIDKGFDFCSFDKDFWANILALIMMFYSML